MTNTQQLIAGMTISVEGNIYRVESCVKVTVAKGTPFIKAKLKDLMTDETVEKNFKVGQSVTEVNLAERTLEYLYLEGKDYLFLDIGELEQVLIPAPIISEKVNFLKEGVHVKARSYGETIFSIELPQFLELMIVKTEPADHVSLISNGTKSAILETGAKIEVPLFTEVGDIVKVDTQTCDYIQRV
ncbi:elongation factor P [Rhabdochlamydiaceae symbiont of Dictyostelium giganteum]|uniref:elongation factor P n=1 Tax=Rhabdochlamydiaceae symbiont of Dictyostelium giganteum TaxID=3342349 RepID=UPI00384F966F